MCRFRLYEWSVVGLLVVVGATSCLYAQAEAVRFDRDIRPILSKHCLHCHGRDESDREADLRLDTRDGMLEDRGGYQAVVPRQPTESEVYVRITSDDDASRMPPIDCDDRLTESEIDLIQRWIEEGAIWQDHWAFVAPQRPPLPEIQQGRWLRTPIDRFVLAELQRRGLHPSPAADRRTLIRRVTLDLTGLPPRSEEVAEFVADPSPDAFESVVDRLLGSPHYGEHMARYWLDAARYADTHGLHLDNYREMWPYRDWVIRRLQLKHAVRPVSHRTTGG